MLPTACWQEEERRSSQEGLSTPGTALANAALNMAWAALGFSCAPATQPVATSARSTAGRAAPCVHSAVSGPHHVPGGCGWGFVRGQKKFEKSADSDGPGDRHHPATRLRPIDGYVVEQEQKRQYTGSAANHVELGQVLRRLRALYVATYGTIVVNSMATGAGQEAGEPRHISPGWVYVAVVKGFLRREP